MRGRRRRTRCIDFAPTHTCFKPCGARGRHQETLELKAEEFEALRLMDYEGLYQQAGADRMGISRPSFARTLAEARRKVIDALLHGKRLRIAIADHPSPAQATAHNETSPSRQHKPEVESQP